MNDAHLVYETGEVIVSYKSKGRAAEQRQSLSYDLHDKTAVTWDDDQKVAAFITPADSALRNYTSFIRQACKEETIPTYNDPLQLAVQVFHALGEIGCLYQADPALPFTKVPGRDYARLHPDRGMTINLEGDLWVPVEVTLIGKTGFLETWRKGMEEWAAYENNPEKRGLFRTRKCQGLYRPVGLRETDLGLQYGRKEDILGNFRKDLDKLIETLTEDARSTARKSGAKQDCNKLGIVYAELRRYSQAEEAFTQALRLDSTYKSARINLSNLLFLKQDYPAALALFQDIYREIERTGEWSSAMGLRVLLNISKTCYQMANYTEAQQYFEKARTIDPEQVKQFAYLTERRPDEARAAAEKDLSYEILFLEE
jgi:tetratricopeptide (TPR) repeat protein